MNKIFLFISVHYNIFLYLKIILLKLFSVLCFNIFFTRLRNNFKTYILLGVQLCFRRFSINDFSGKWWSK